MNVNIDDSLVALFLSPDAVQELLPRQILTARFEERDEQFILPHGEGDLLAA
jgi:hypothetical protein